MENKQGKKEKKKKTNQFYRARLFQSYRNGVDGWVRKERWMVNQERKKKKKKKRRIVKPKKPCSFHGDHSQKILY